MVYLSNPFNCFIVPVQAMLRSRTLPAITQETIDEIQASIDDITNKIQHRSSDHQVAVDRFNKIKRGIKGLPTEMEKHEMRVLLMQKREAESHTGFLHKQLASMQFELSKVRGFAYVSATAASTAKTQRNINKLMKHYSPDSVYNVMETRDQTLEEMTTFKREMEARMDNAASPEMDVEGELEQVLDAHLREQLMNNGNVSVAISSMKAPPQYHSSEDKQPLLVTNKSDDDHDNDMYRNCY